MIAPPQWLETFYQNSDEKIDLQRVLTQRYPAEFNSWLLPLIEAVNKKQMPCFIPSARPDLQIYALAPDAKSLDELRLFLIAGLGSADTPSDFLVRCKADNDAEALLLEQSPDGFIRFSLHPSVEKNTDSRDRVFGFLAELNNLYTLRPQLSSAARRPTGRILRDFYTAIYARDGQSAEAYLGEIRSNNILSPRNILFLELFALAAGSRWEHIAAHEKIGDVLAGRIPLNIQSLLVRTLGHLGLDRLLTDGFQALPLEEARALSQRLLSLFTVIPGFPHQEGSLRDWQLWTTGAALVGFADWESATTILPDQWKASLREWVGGQTTPNKSVIPAPIQTPFLLISPAQATEMLQETLIASTERELEIYSLLSAMPDVTQQTLRQNTKLWRLWEELQDKFRVGNYGWMRWLDDIGNTNDVAQLEQLRQRMDGQWREWLVSSFDEAAIIAFLEKGLSLEQGKVLRDTLPVFLAWADHTALSASSRLWLAWLTLLAADDIHFEQDVRLGGMLLEKCLAGQFSVEEYKDALDACEEIWVKNASVRALSYAFDTAEILLDAPVPDSQLRQNYWQKLQIEALKRWGRLDNSLQLFVRVLAMHFLGKEAENAFPQEQDDSAVVSSFLRDLNGKLLGIYSLTEGAARRCKDVLMRLYPGLVVETNKDHVSTPALVNLAEKADYFIFASGSAKHQAFYTVSDCRKAIIYPSGKGVSSMVAAFIQALG